MVSAAQSPKASQVRRENLEFEVLSALLDEPGLSQRELARRLGASLGRMNACMQAMLADGHVCLSASAGQRANAPHGYVLTGQGASRRDSLSAAYLARKRAELERLAGQVETVARSAGSASKGATNGAGKTPQGEGGTSR